MQLNNILILTSSPTLLNLYLKKNFPKSNFKILYFDSDDFDLKFNSNKTKSLFEQENDILVIKNFFKKGGNLNPKNLIFWEEKLPQNETFNFYIRNFNLKIIKLDEKNTIKEFVKDFKIDISDENLDYLLDLYLKDENGIESFLNEIEKFSVFKKIDKKLWEELFFSPFWIKEEQVWNDLENSVISLFFLKKKKEFFKKAKKLIKQNIRFENFLGEFNFVLKALSFKKIFNLSFLPFNIKKIQDRFDKYWSYTEIKKLVDFIAEADLKIKRGTLSKEIIDELLKFI
jgi:hypothetical protein